MRPTRWESLTLIWVGFLKVSLYLKLVRIKLEAWNLVCKCTHIWSLRKYTFQYQDSLSGIRLADCSKLGIKRKNDNDVTICYYDAIVRFLWRCCVSLVKFSYLSKMHVNIIIGSGVMTILVYKGLTRKPEIGKPVSGFCAISGDSGELGIPHLAWLSLKSYWMLQNVMVTTFTVSE